jgi:hypothetical protein
MTKEWLRKHIESIYEELMIIKKNQQEIKELSEIAIYKQKEEIKEIKELLETIIENQE